MENLIETQLTSEEIFDGRILHLYNDTVRLPNGKTAPREVTRHVGAVCVVPLLDDGRVIVERQFRYPVNEVITEIPAGKRDSKDEDPELAARRELREETGIEAKELICLGKFYPAAAYSDEVIWMYLAKGLTFGKQQLDGLFEQCRPPRKHHADGVWHGHNLGPKPAQHPGRRGWHAH